MTQALRARAARMTVAVASAVAGALLVGGLAAPAAAAVPVASVPVAGSAPAPAAVPVTVNFDQFLAAIEDQVLAEYPEAFLVEVDGSAPALTRSATRVREWRFVFNNIVDGQPNEVVFATAQWPIATAEVRTVSGVWVGSDPLVLPIGMSPIEASALLRAAGYFDAYRFITLRKPNAGGPAPNPLYIFGPIRGGYVGVDTVTGQVAPLAVGTGLTGSIG